MEKNPAFLFYPKDWISDTQLQQTTFQTRGIWMELLMRMHLGPRRGEITGRLDSLSRMIGCDVGVFCVAIREILSFGVGDIFKLSQECPATLSDIAEGSDELFVVRNRRMVRDEKTRVYERERKRLQRCGDSSSDQPGFLPPQQEKIACPGSVPVLSRTCPGDVPSRARPGTATATAYGSASGTGEGDREERVQGGKPQGAASGDNGRTHPKAKTGSPPEALALRDQWNEQVRKANGLNADDTGAAAIPWMVRRHRDDGLTWEAMARAQANYARQAALDLAGGSPRPVALRNFWGSDYRAEAYLAEDWQPSASRARASPRKQREDENEAAAAAIRGTGDEIPWN